VDRRAEKQLADLPVEVRGRFGRAFEALSRDPRRPRPGCDIRKVQGTHETWAVRVGSYRGLYAIVGDIVLVTTILSGHRAYG
jgi:mRNA-degrading endonuclease RelE of RelBE toxin-antitoxin system